MSIYRVLLVVSLAFVFGLGVGHLGSVALHQVESSSHPSHEPPLHSVAILAATPGLFAAEWQTGYDWRWDEAWLFRAPVRHWNAAFYSAVAFALVVPFAIRRLIRYVAASRGSAPTQTYDF